MHNTVLWMLCKAQPTQVFLHFRLRLFTTTSSVNKPLSYLIQPARPGSLKVPFINARSFNCFFLISSSPSSYKHQY